MLMRPRITAAAAQKRHEHAVQPRLSVIDGSETWC
jgi:hypothetical protein